jgi:hypothetical protein
MCLCMYICCLIDLKVRKYVHIFSENILFRYSFIFVSVIKKDVKISPYVILRLGVSQKIA